MNNTRIASELVKAAKVLLAEDDKTEAYEKLLKEVSRGQAILTAGELHPDIPTIHTFAGKYRNTVDHMGYGMFKGSTPNGEFTFDGGGAMRREGDISWCPLSADKDVLRDLKYSLPKVKRALKELLAGGMTASQRVAARPGSPVDIGNRREKLIIDGMKKLAAKFGFKVMHIPNQSHRIDTRGNISFYIDQPSSDSTMRFPDKLVRLMKSTGEPGLKYVHDMSNGVEANHFSWEKLLIKAGINRKELLSVNKTASERTAGMSFNSAIRAAKKMAKRFNKEIFVVKDDGYQVASADELDTFHAGIEPEAVVHPDGEVER